MRGARAYSRLKERKSKQIHIPFLFCIFKENRRLVKMIYMVIYISPEHMGHNTFKSMGRVLCVVRRSDGNARKCKQHRLARIPLQFLYVHVHPLVTRSVYICVISTLRGAYTLCPHYRLIPTSKTRHINPMFDRWWPTVYDVVQHR